MTRKTELRQHWLEVRKSIPQERRIEAASSLFLSLKNKFSLNTPLEPVLSFASFGSEIDTHLLNDWLAEKKLLLLPKIENDALLIYQVHHPNLDLIRSRFGMLEPDPNRCTLISWPLIHTVLVPGLAFDSSFHRLGYGKGHYDRLLSHFCYFSIGIAFREQKIDRLPSDVWDIALNQVLFF